MVNNVGYQIRQAYLTTYWRGGVDLSRWAQAVQNHRSSEFGVSPARCWRAAQRRKHV